MPESRHVIQILTWEIPGANFLGVMNSHHSPQTKCVDNVLQCQQRGVIHPRAVSPQALHKVRPEEEQLHSKKRDVFKLASSRESSAFCEDNVRSNNTD